MVVLCYTIDKSRHTLPEHKLLKIFYHLKLYMFDTKYTYTIILCNDFDLLIDINCINHASL